MNRVVQILMDRDGLSVEEAEEEVGNCVDELKFAIQDGDYDLIEDILKYDLGLEMDYIFDLI